jgi:hypothetical protein
LSFSSANICILEVDLGETKRDSKCVRFEDCCVRA